MVALQNLEPVSGSGSASRNSCIEHNLAFWFVGLEGNERGDGEEAQSLFEEEEEEEEEEEVGASRRQGLPPSLLFRP